MKTVVLSACCGDNYVSALTEAGLSSSDISRATFVPQSLSQMYNLSRASRPFVLIDELWPDISVRSIINSASSLACLTRGLALDGGRIAIPPSQHELMSAAEAIIATLAVAALPHGSSTVWVTCERASVVGRGMLHASQISHAIHSDAGWDIRIIRCRSHPTVHNIAKPINLSSQALLTPGFGLGKLHALVTNSRRSLLLSSGFDLKAQVALLERNAVSYVRHFGAPFTSETSDKRASELTLKPTTVAEMGGDYLPVTPNIQVTTGAVRLSEVGLQALVRDALAHHDIVGEATTAVVRRLQRLAPRSWCIFVGRGTPARRTLALELSALGHSVFTLPHGVGEGHYPSPSTVSGDVHFLPRLAARGETGSGPLAPQYFDPTYLRHTKPKWEVRSGGTLVAMTDVPFGGAWPTWSWGIAEFGDALAAVSEEFKRRNVGVQLRERPSDHNKVGSFLKSRYRIDMDTSMRPPESASDLVGIGYSGSLLIEAAFHGRRCVTVDGRFNGKAEDGTAARDALIPEVCVDDHGSLATLTDLLAAPRDSHLSQVADTTSVTSDGITFLPLSTAL